MSNHAKQVAKYHAQAAMLGLHLLHHTDENTGFHYAITGRVSPDDPTVPEVVSASDKHSTQVEALKQAIERAVDSIK